MSDKELNLREAGSLIGNSSIVDDVVKADETSLGRRFSNEDSVDETNEAGSLEGGEDELDDLTSEDDGSNPNDIAEGDEDGSHDDDDLSDEDVDGADGEGEPSSTVDPMLVEYEVTVSGETSKVPLKDIIKNYQLGTDYTQKTQALAQNRRELTETHTKLAKEVMTKFQISEAVTNNLRNILIGDINSAEMAQLKQSNPQQWAVERLAMQDRVTQIDNILGQIRHEQASVLGQVQQQQQQDVETLKSQERALLQAKMPDWTSETEAKLGQYLVNTGFSAGELGNVTDHRMLVVAEKARLYDEHMAQAKAPLKKKVKQLPKTVKGGQGQIQPKPKKNARNQSRYKQAVAKAKKKGDMRSAGEAIAHLL